MKLAQPKIRDTEEGPPRTEGVVPLPRSERGGSGAAAQGVLKILVCTQVAPLAHRQVAQRHALPRRTQPGGTQALEHAIGKLAPAGHGLRHCTLFHHFDTIRIT